VVAVLGLFYTGFKDYSTGAIKIPQIAQTTQITQPAQPIVYPQQFCLMMYDPNTDLVWYQHDSGTWHTTPPAQKKVGVYY
jgi:hypothetical protein